MREKANKKSLQAKQKLKNSEGTDKKAEKQNNQIKKQKAVKNRSEGYKAG